MPNRSAEISCGVYRMFVWHIRVRRSVLWTCNCQSPYEICTPYVDHTFMIFLLLQLLMQLRHFQIIRQQTTLVDCIIPRSALRNLVNDLQKSCCYWSQYSVQRTVLINKSFWRCVREADVASFWFLHFVIVLSSWMLLISVERWLEMFVKLQMWVVFLLLQSSIVAFMVEIYWTG